MDFEEAINIAKVIIKRFKKIEGKPWGAEGSMIELSKQVGELSKLVMVREGYYFYDRVVGNEKYEATQEKIGDELADILYSVIRLADHYDIDLETAHINARKGEDKLLRSKGV